MYHKFGNFRFKNIFVVDIEATKLTSTKLKHIHAHTSIWHGVARTKILFPMKFHNTKISGFTVEWLCKN